MSLIKDRTIGITYVTTTYHIGIRFAHEDDNSNGTSFLIEYNHKSHTVRIKSMTGNNVGSFGQYVNENPNIVAGEVLPSGFFPRYRVTNYVFDRLEQVYARWILSKADKS